MFNLNTDDISSIGNIIGTIILFIILIIGFLIIFDEFFHLSKFCFYYTYLFNFGHLNENICKKDNNNLIEFEKARFRIYNQINSFKLHKDLFNNNWINYSVFISILIFSLLMCFAFGYVIYFFFILNNNNCNINDNKTNLSFLNRLLGCSGFDFYLPNCTFNYFILFIIIFIYPFIFFLKYFFKIDYSFDNNNFFIKSFHIFTLLSLLYFIYLLFIIKNDNDDFYNINKLFFFISFMIVFYIANFIFNNAFTDYYNINKGSNIYSINNNNIINILNKYFHFTIDNSSHNNFNDNLFFEIYKQQEPDKPIEPTPPENISTFKICNSTDFTNSNNLFCFNKKDEYDQNKKKIDEYYKEKDIYDKNLNIYNLKFNISKNHKINFPEFVPLITHMIPKLLGFDKKSHIILFIFLILVLFYYNYLKTNNKTNYANYVFYTIIIYIIANLSILILSNSILTYNTYVNKYLIYEPISFYKEDLFNMDILFNILLNKDNYKSIADNYINLYNQLNNTKKLPTFNGNNIHTTSENIKTINEKKNVETISLTLNNPDSNSLNIYKQIFKVIYSNLLKFNNNIKDITTKLKDFTSKFTNISTFDSENIITYSSTYDANMRTFFIIIKNIFIENPSEIDNIINKLKNNLKYLIYKDTKYTFTDLEDFYNNFLIINKNNTELLEIDYTDTNDLIKTYLNNLHNINKIFDYYKEFLIEFRQIIIDLFNNTDIYCENNNNIININEKLNQYFLIVFTNKNFIGNYLENFNYNDENTTPKINIYKKILQLNIDKFNLKFYKFINIIKIILHNDIKQINDISTNKLKYNIINNYNFFNKDSKKHIEEELIEKVITIDKKNIINKYDKYSTDKLLKLNLSINNISWSFVILMIIFTIFLLEPIIIQS